MSRRNRSLSFNPGFGLQAAGKVLSNKNSKVLKTLAKQAKELSDSISSILNEAGEEEETEEEESTQAGDSSDSGLTSAESNYSKQLKRSNWYARLDNTLRIFSYFFEDACWYQAQGEALDEDNSIEEMVKDLSAALLSLASSYELISAMDSAIQAASNSADFVQIQCNALNLIEAGSENCYPIEGVLFKIDEPSEGVPSVGPGKPLYISKAVAAKALEQVMGLPLDADDSLAKHANEEIVGVMLSGQIKGNDFKIRGQLYPFNQPKKVAAIKAAKHKLGMSMNALAPGHVEEINGREVHVVDSLTLLGANILYAEAATYKQTQVVATSENAATPQPELVAASDSQESNQSESPSEQNNSSNQENDPIMEEKINQLSEQVKTLVDSVAQLASSISTVSASVNTLNQEREQRITQEAQAQEQQSAQRQREEMQALMRDTATQAVRQILNPSGQPPRLSSEPSPVQAGEGLSPEYAELIRCEGQLQELGRHHDATSMTRRFELKQKISDLKTRLGVS